MLKLGVLLLIYGIAGSVLVNLIMFVRFVSRAQQPAPIFGELLGMLLKEDSCDLIPNRLLRTVLNQPSATSFFIA